MKKSLVAAIVAVVGFAPVAAAADDRIRVRTSLTLHYQADSHPKTFVGEVKAKKGCQRDRRVILWGRNGRAGSDRSNARGLFKIVKGRNSPSGRGRYARRAGRDPYLAFARKKMITKPNGDTIACRKGRSNGVGVLRP